MGRKGKDIKMAASRKWTYFFGNGRAEGAGEQRSLLGGKGAGLAEMTRIGLPVPAGFTITTEACAAYNERNGKWPQGLEPEVRRAMIKLERACRRKFGDPKNPLLVSVRSGAARSMPGMMETILNLGLTDKSVEGLAQSSNDRRFALDAYRRLIMMYGATARGIERERFEHVFDEIKRGRSRVRLGRGADEKILDTDVDADELAEVIDRFKRIYEEHCSEPFPQDPFKQLKGAIDAVFNSWMAEKAVTYRRVERITGLNGTAVNVCQMVFGNMGEDSGTGVCFTRDPSTGECEFYGDMLINAQGEDVVAGIRTPMKLAELERLMPAVYDQLEAVRAILEVHYRDMQDLEFTIERGKLYMLQTRVGKRSPGAAFKIAVDQATKGLLSAATARRLSKKKLLPKRYAGLAIRPFITKDEAIRRIQPVDVERLFYPVIDPQIPAETLSAQQIAEGIGAVPGAASGIVVFSAADAEVRSADGTNVILVRKETSPEDVGGMHVAAGILTATGGKTSHAAVVARGWGKCCIVGCEALDIDYASRRFSVNGKVIPEGAPITLDGTTGRVFEGRIRLVRPSSPPEFETLMNWCDARRRLSVRANADTPSDAARAVELGAEGVGLCRTEHMFFDPSQTQRLTAMREMILAETEEARRRALDKLLPFQRSDFEGVFEAMDGRPVTVRLLDPPLHEFLPHHDNEEGQRSVANALNEAVQRELARTPYYEHATRKLLEARCVSLEEIRRRVDQLREANPMLGHRGCRLCITFPEILEMQVRAIIEAAVNCTQRGITVLPEIMIPLSIDPKELSHLIDQTRATADAVLKERGSKLSYFVGTMIETPRAALTADRMAESAEFFSFGTNDLTQLAMGLSRDDAGRFLPDYVDPVKTGIFQNDPFQTLDGEGVGEFVRMSVEKGRSTRPRIKLGICGEHGGDPESIRFFERVGLDYVSCSPLRVPIARLAAAQAAIELGSPATSRRRSKPKKKKAVRSGRRPAKKGTRTKVKKSNRKPRLETVGTGGKR